MLFLLLALIALSYAAPTERASRLAFYDWQAKYQKTYLSFAEQSRRFRIFRDNFQFVHDWDSAKRGFSVALNQFADMTGTEFAAFYNGLNITAEYEHTTPTPVDDVVPASWDWRTHGAVTPVKNQGQCGSCWSFSATGSTEGAHFLKTKSLVSLSEQNLIDCSTAEGNDGCNGGFMDDAFKYIIRNKGIDTEESYPYTATGPNTCHYKVGDKAATLASFHDVTKGDEVALLNAVAKTPVSVAIDASHPSFQLYSHGIYYEPKCSSTNLDHGVLAVGWGNEGGKDFWLVKNSWGASWGDAGYIKMSRNRANNCGIATAASYPIV